MSSTVPILERYKLAVENNRIPNRISIPNEHFVSNVLPGRVSSSNKRLRTLKKILTPNEMTYFTKGFKGRQLNRNGLPVSGRGIAKKKSTPAFEKNNKKRGIRGSKTGRKGKKRTRKNRGKKKIV